MHLFWETQLQLKMRWKVMLEFTTHVQFGIKTNQVSASRVNPVFWLDKITRESPYTRVKKIEEIQASETSKSHGAIHAVSFRGGSVAEGSARRTRNPAVPGSRPALATCGFVLGRPEFKFSPTLVNWQLVAFCQLGFLILLCCISIICFWVFERSGPVS